ncbi:hypothetical protein BD779DRAFT_1801904 [Infundibulicybe gibba]|nr:hypothetical protein BD779DRAFT_1801904 [Infundibulicybe gibba]
MLPSKDSANHHRSSAVPNPNKSNVLPKSRRGPHSIVAACGRWIELSISQSTPVPGEFIRPCHKFGPQIVLGSVSQYSQSSKIDSPWRFTPIGPSILTSIRPNQRNSAHDKNVYPGAPRSRHRTSHYFVTTKRNINHTTIMPITSDSATVKEDFDELNDVPEITGIIPQKLMRKQSLHGIGPVTLIPAAFRR